MLRFFAASNLAGQWAGVDEFYWANHHVTMSVNCGVTVGDSAAAFAPALAAFKAGHSANSDEFRNAIYDGMTGTAAWLLRAADADDGASRPRSAADKRLRAAAFYELADWYFWPWSSPVKSPTNVGRLFNLARGAFRAAVEIADRRARWVKVPFAGVELTGLFIRSEAAQQSPVVVHFNGMHSSLHWHYLSGLPTLLAERGVSSLLFDHPGVGDARYHLNLKARADTESYARSALQWLEAQGDVDSSRIGVVGGSFGGYRAARAAACLSQIKAVALWGAYFSGRTALANYWPMLIQKLWDGDPFNDEEQEVCNELQFWTGTNDRAELLEALRQIDLAPVLAGLRAPLLIVHGASDVQVPVDEALKTRDHAVNSRRVDLVLTDEPIGGGQHVNWDNPRNALCLIADWLKENLG